ncbi:NTF2-related export protein [Gryllus bimaculatus]|nr:NTF2-related export protein [Gryllus bimaculatus]
MEQEHRTKVEQACRTAEEFIKHYYEGLDRRRNVMSRLYLDTATLLWNGNGIAGKEFIQKFFENLPSTDHVVSSIDSQPLTTGTTCHFPLTIVVSVSGFIAFCQEQPQAFQQQLLITAEGDKWKIVSDCFRFQEP